MAATLALYALLATAGELPHGSAQCVAECKGMPIELFTYKPESYTDGPLILVFHGVLRNAEDYRDHARRMGDRFHALIVAPRFPEARFPTASYQQGGLRLKGEVRPPNARRIVVANPGTYLFPSTDAAYPLGFGGLTDELSDEAALRRYLAQPITLYLARNDTERDEHFDTTPPAERQGRTRWERGQNTFRAAQELARRHGWEFNWRLVAVPGVGHDHEAMFNDPRCAEALFGPKEDSE